MTVLELEDTTPLSAYVLPDRATPVATVTVHRFGEVGVT